MCLFHSKPYRFHYPVQRLILVPQNSFSFSSFCQQNRLPSTPQYVIRAHGLQAGIYMDSGGPWIDIHGWSGDKNHPKWKSDMSFKSDLF